MDEAVAICAAVRKVRAPSCAVSRGESFATHADRRRAKALQVVAAFLEEVPAHALTKLRGPVGTGPAAMARVRIAATALLAKAGPDGANAAQGLKAWRLLRAFAAARGLPEDGLPAEASLVAEIVAGDMLRAVRAAEAKGEPGGASVGMSSRAGFLFLEKAALMDVPASSPLVLAAAQPPEGAARQVRHAGSMPLKLQMQLEAVAAGRAWSVARVIARALLVACLVHHVRLNDALNALVYADEAEPDAVVRGRTKVRSKDGLPMQLYAPAEGFLGPLSWLGSHLAEMSDRKHAVPDFDGRSLASALRLRSGVISPARARAAFRELCTMAPLRMTVVEFEELAISTHSPHGTGADLVRFAASVGQPGWSEPDARAMGHWLRDKNAPQPDPRAAKGDAHANKHSGQKNARGIMTHRYAQGSGRRGERSEQLRVRSRLVAMVRDALERFGRPWTELPAGLADWDVLAPAL